MQRHSLHPLSPKIMDVLRRQKHILPRARKRHFYPTPNGRAAEDAANKNCAG